MDSRRSPTNVRRDPENIRRSLPRMCHRPASRSLRPLVSLVPSGVTVTHKHKLFGVLDRLIGYGIFEGYYAALMKDWQNQFSRITLDGRVWRAVEPDSKCITRCSPPCFISTDHIGIWYFYFHRKRSAGADDHFGASHTGAHASVLRKSSGHIHR